MKKYIFTFTLLFNLNLYAHPEPQIFQGEYFYKGNYQVVSLRLEEYVSIDTEAGQGKVNQYKNEGFTCYSIEETVTYCYKEASKTQDHPQLREEIKNKYQNFSMKIYHAVGPAELLYNSNDYKYWQVEQKTIVSGSYFPETYYSLLFDIQSISLGPDENAIQYTFRCSDKILINSEHINILTENGLNMRFLVDIHLE